MPRTASIDPLPLPYTLFFLWIEPVSTIVGAYFAHFQQEYYMHATVPDAGAISIRESVVLSQLANLYFAFTLNEALVLRSTRSRKVWNTLLLGLLIADFGHIYACKAAGLELYYSIWKWNVMWFGNLGFVYIGATLRTCFLLGIGLPSS
ncbi:hypothetical protein CKM354_000341400 [Cercospora kikuchii]|uniref:DUF7704 domain-containing protein n=1 Tax=Cercospora kikuchii TaxID=84275 RepID=A0A9P3CHQ1_9PEZI|nr:uncharacterized protein CKM354_000341400 [Cercospora kikuchii]GIZ40060.1 hypothetical protein CKM354_000341400 [Cercospora kikuchii]